MEKESKIFVAGGTGLVGSALLRNLKKKSYANLVASFHRREPVDEGIKWVRLDLTRQEEVEEFFQKEAPEYVFLAAAKVGGIWANNVYRAEFIYENLQIQTNVIHYAYEYGVKKLLFLGSTCIYPKECPQPMREEYLLTAPLEYTNEPYAVAKIAGMKMCESYNLQYGTNFIAVMPTNLYGYYDNFDLEKSHVLPALIRKMHLGKLLEANDWEGIREDLRKTPLEGVGGESSLEEIQRVLRKYGIFREEGRVKVEIWGTGKPRREFLWSDDMADACVYLMEKVDFIDIVRLIYPDLINVDRLGRLYTEREIRNTHINIGTGEDLSIRELAFLVKKIVGFEGELFFNTSKPDGTPRKVTDVRRLHSLGWRHSTDLEEGLRKLYAWYCR